MNGGSTIQSGSSGDDVLEMAVDPDRLPCPARARATTNSTHSESCVAEVRRMRVRLLVGAVVLVAALMADVMPVSGHIAPGLRVTAVDQGLSRSPTVDDTPQSSPATPDSPAPVVPAPSVPAPSGLEALDAQLAAAGYDVPTGAGVYAVKVNGGGESPPR